MQGHRSFPGLCIQAAEKNPETFSSQDNISSENSIPSENTVLSENKKYTSSSE